MVFEVNSLRPIGVNPTAGTTIWHYSSTADNLDTIFTANYFQADDSSIGLNDTIIIQATDGVSLVSVASIDGSGNITLKLFDQFAAQAAVDITFDPTNFDAGGTFLNRTDVQDALEYVVDRINLKVQALTTVGSGVAVQSGVDTTDPVRRLGEIRSITGADSEADIDVSLNGDTIEIAAQNTLLRQGVTSTTGSSLIRNANTGGDLDLRGLTSDTGSIDIAVEGVDVDINIADDGVDTNQIANDAVQNAQIATSAVNADSIASGAVGNSELAVNSVSASRIQDAQVSSAKLTAGLNSEIDDKQDGLSNNGGSGAVILINGDELRRLVEGSGISITTNGADNIVISSP